LIVWCQAVKRSGDCSLRCQTADVARSVYSALPGEPSAQAMQRVGLGSSLGDVFAANFAVSEPTRADSTATGSWGGGPGEGGDDEPP